MYYTDQVPQIDHNRYINVVKCEYYELRNVHHINFETVTK